MLISYCNAQHQHNYENKRIMMNINKTTLDKKKLCDCVISDDFSNI